MITQEIWDLAFVVHEARMKLCYGSLAASKQPFPMTAIERRSYGHNPNTWTDQALAIAKAVLQHQTPKEVEK